MRGIDDVLASVTLPAVPVYFYAGILEVTLEKLWRNYDKYRHLADESEAAGGLESAERVDSEALLEKDLLSA